MDTEKKASYAIYKDLMDAKEPIKIVLFSE